MSELRDVDATPVAWREAGSGPLVVFLGGLGTTRSGFDPQLLALAPAYRCVIWDMPGFGLSAAPDKLTFPVLADAVAALIETLGETQAHLAGLSMGGQIALHTALRHPERVRSLAILDSSPAFGLDGTDPEEWTRLRVSGLDAGETPTSMAEPVLRSIMAPDVADSAVAAAVASMSRISSDGFRAAVECLTTHDVRDRLGEIDVPTLVINGELDEETPLSYAEAIANGIRGAQLRGHPRLRPHLQPGGAGGSQRRAAPPSRRRRGRLRDGVALDRRLRAPAARLRADRRRGRGRALGVGQPRGARLHEPHRRAHAGRARVRHHRPHAAQQRLGAAALDRRLGGAGRQPGRDRRPRRPPTSSSTARSRGCCTHRSWARSWAAARAC